MWAPLMDSGQQLRFGGLELLLVGRNGLLQESPNISGLTVRRWPLCCRLSSPSSDYIACAYGAGLMLIMGLYLLIP